MKSLNEILEYTQLRNKVIDIFKIDIEHNEWEVLMDLDCDYACKYFKQFALETHPSAIYVSPVDSLKHLRILEKCFLLFHRDTRYFFNSIIRNGVVENKFQSGCMSLETF